MKYRQGGFTLVEMMVAMLLGIMILMAVSEVFVNNNRTRVEIENTTRQIENGRYAMQLLEGELANAGFFGEWSGTVPPAEGNPTVSACLSSVDDVRKAVNVPVSGGGALVDGSTDCIKIGFKAGNDYLGVRRSSTCVVGDAECDVFESGRYHLQISACEDDNPGEILLQAASAIADMNYTQRDCTTRAPVYRFLSRLYYVRDDNVLMRAELGAGAYAVTPLVDGIERLHFAYGLDDNDDGAVDRFLDSDDVDLGQVDASGVAARWDNVVAIRIWLLARNLEPTPGYTDARSYSMGNEVAYTPADGFKRQLYTSTVRLNNVAGRRESPVVAGGVSAEEPPAETPPAETPSDPAI